MDSLLNKLPSSWPLVPIGSICQVGAGNGAPQGDVFFAGGTYPFVRMQDVGRCQTPYIRTTTDRLNGLALEKHSLRQWPAGSLLIPKSGASVALNKRALLREPSYVVSHLAVLVPGDLIDSEYLYYLFCTLDMMRLALDPAYPSLRTSDLARLRIPLPPLSEQHRIVKILQEAEEIRRLRSEAEVKTLDLIPRLFLSMFGDPGHNPKKWPRHQVSSLAIKFSDGPFGSNLKSSHYTQYGVRIIRLQNIGVGSLLTDDEAFISEDHFESISKHECLTGDVLIGTLGEPNLRACILPKQIGRALNKADCVQFRPDQSRVTAAYVCWLLNMPGTVRMAQSLQAGQTRSRISMGRLATLMVPCPPLKLQQEFEKVVQEITEIDETIRQSNHIEKTLAASLSAHAFSGQLTADWRETHKEMLTIEARDRDAALKEAGATISLAHRTMIQEIEELLQDRTDGIYADLNREQHDLLRVIERKDHEEGEGYYFTAEQLASDMKGPLHRHPQRIESHLSLFAVRGLIIPLSRRRLDTSGPTFAACYRLPIIADGFTGNDEAPSNDIRAMVMDTQRRLVVGNI